MSAKGTIVLMGSGELTATMVEVYKEMLARSGPQAQAVFLDTPAGFQLNADLISERAVEYFRTRVGRPLSVASFKSRATATAFESGKAFMTLRQADLVLVGPGSPTYALRQWRETPVADILAERISAGACLVAASAAALTVGRFTLPVYEIYKVGEGLRWADGTDLLARFGFNLVVVPHWNNAEGGNHDTRFCFMGAPRFRSLASMLPEDAGILGLDEHTACIIELGRGEVQIRGLGGVTLRRAGAERRLGKNERFPLDILRDAGAAGPKPAVALAADPPPEGAAGKGSIGAGIHALGQDFNAGLEARDPARLSAALLELERIIWEAARDFESEESLSRARETLHAWIVVLATRMAEAPRDAGDCLSPVVEEMLALRRHFRDGRQWSAADAIRDGLERANVAVEDTPQGSRWRAREPNGGRPYAPKKRRDPA
jgi:peptidase E